MSLILLPPRSIVRRTLTSLGKAGGIRPYYLLGEPRTSTFRNTRYHDNSFTPKIFQRGAKSKSSVMLQDLPQGRVGPKLEEMVVEDEKISPAYPTVVQQAKDNMVKFDNCVLLTRVGGFYELYFEHASIYGPLMNLKVSYKKTNAGPVPMAGFPFFQLDRFLKILVQELNKYVAISEEFPNNLSGQVKSGGLLFDRRVTRVVTPGTLIDERFLDTSENNFLLAIHLEGTPDVSSNHQREIQRIEEEMTSEITKPQNVGLAWLDLSTGDFFTQSITQAALPSAISRIAAREVILDESLRSTYEEGILKILQQTHQVVTFQKPSDKFSCISDWDPMLDSAGISPTQSEFFDEEVAAGNALLRYVKARLQGLQMKLQHPIRTQVTEIMGIDRSSMKGLEILETSKDGFGRGSLLHSVRRTVTKSGARLLRNRLTAPSTSLETVNERLDLVSLFLDNQDLHGDVLALLGQSYDSQRLVQKFTLGKGDADDLISLLRTIEATRHISETLQAFSSGPSSIEQSLSSILSRLSTEGPGLLAENIAAAIDEEGLQQQHQIEQGEAAALAELAKDVVDNENAPEHLKAIPKKSNKDSIRSVLRDREQEESDDTWIMRESASPALLESHEMLRTLRQEKLELVETLRGRLAASSLTLRWTPSLGYICHVKGRRDSQLALQDLPGAKVLGSSKSTKSFYVPDWSDLGSKIDQVKLQIRKQEQILFEELRAQVITNLVKLRRNAAVLDELDVACSFATLAREQNFVRPSLNLGTAHKIIQGRHPVVKQGLEEQGKSFVSNDCFVGDGDRIWLITGPNMAGKSTFLRQNALISILAQVGSFVPAELAEIGIVDHIFSRIGAADDLFRDQSTFMVEMLETAAILKQATPRSFVIMDEVGRGTTPEDGIAVGYACLHHLYKTNRCRTLFATHFHALTDMTQGFDKIGCYCTDVIEDVSGAFSFDRRMRKGINRHSHALKVAALAGLPQSAIGIAEEVLAEFRITHQKAIVSSGPNTISGTG